MIKNNSLPGPLSLLEEAWKIYRRNFKIFLVLSLLVSFSSFTSNILPFLGGINLKSSPALVILLTIVGIAVSFWGSVSMLYTIRDEENGTNIRDSLAKGWKKLLPYAWVLFLSIFITFGGLILFIVPGILFFVWFFMADFIVVSENVGGMSALLKSREYIRGYFWAVAGRLLFVWIIGILTFWTPVYLFKLLHLPSYVSSIYSFISHILGGPFYLAYGFLLYRHLKSIKGGITIRSSSKNKAFFYNLWRFGSHNLNHFDNIVSNVCICNITRL